MNILFVAFFVSLSAFTVRADNLPPGTYKCYPPQNANRYIRGYCKYQVKPDGAGFSDLLRFAQRLVMDWPGGMPPSPNNVDPVPGMGDQTITWWFDDMAANDELGRQLRENDVARRVYERPTVTISATMYSFEKGSNRDLGFDVGYFYGKKPTPEGESQIDRFLGSLTSGIFNVAAGVGNPLASFLSLGVNAAIERRQAETVHDVIYFCDNGEYCDYRRSRTRYILTGIGTEKPEIGLSISTVPRADLTAEGRGLVTLEGLRMSYSLATGNNDEPVEIFEAINGRNFTLKTDELQVLSSDNMRVDVRTGRLLGRGVERMHSQFLILMKVAVSLPGNARDRIVIPEFQNINDDRALTPEELAALPNGELSLQDVLGSIETVCFKDHLNPSNSEPICGFRFTRLDRSLADKMLRVKLKGALRSGYNVRREIVRPASDFLKDKGYYQLPRLRNDKPGKYELEITLDRSNTIANRYSRTQAVYGMKFPFGYYPNTSAPIQFDASYIQWKRR